MNLEKICRKKKPRHFHWYDMDGKDTLCRMLSTGSLRGENYDTLMFDIGLPCCTMCAAVYEKMNRKVTLL